MAKCDRCGAEENMPYRCEYCGGTYCADHRLPENHDCPGLQDWGDPDGVFDSGFDDTVQNPGGAAAGGFLDRVLPDRGAGGVFAYFRNNMTYLFLALMWLTFLLQYVVAFFLTPFGAIGPTINFNPAWEAIFVLSAEHPEYVWTWITSIFAHGGFGHIAFNSIALYFFGPVVERRIGTRKYVALFLIAGAVAGLAQIAVSATIGDPTAGVVGASGAIMAVLGVLTVLNPGLRVYLYFIIPMPLWVLTFGFAAISVFAGFSSLGGAGGIAHFAHLAGLVIGLAYGERVRRQGGRVPEQLQFGGGRGPGGPGRGRGPF